MKPELDTYNELLMQGLQSWKEVAIELNRLDIDWDTPHPSLAVNLSDFDTGLTTAYEMAGNISENLPESIQSLLIIAPNFHALVDSLTKLRELSNAIKDFFKIAKENKHKITVLDINRLNDQGGRAFDLAAHLKKLKAVTGNFLNHLMILKDFLFEGEIYDLSQRIDTFHKLADKVRPIHDDINELRQSSEEKVKVIEEKVAVAQSNLESIQEISTAASDMQKASTEAVAEVNAKLTAIKETHSQAEKLSALVEQYQAKYEAFDEDLDSRNELFKQFEQNNTTAQEQNIQREQEVDRILTKSDQMLKGATNAGLATAFNNASEKYGEEASEAKKAFYWAVVFLIMSVIPLATYVLPLPTIEWLGIEGGKSGDIKFGGILARAILLIPTVWLTTFAGHRYWALFQLHREYSFKAAIAMSVEGFKEQAKEYEQEIAGATFVGLSEKPVYMLSREAEKSPNPIMDYLIRVIQKRFGKMSGSE